uniref:hypothetical protein n=1 Tax=uncultured Methanobrevibacter sp. TaxID=253161 RepID=UPI00262BD0A6
AEISYAGDKVYVESSAVSRIAIDKVVTELITSDVSYIYDEPVDLIVILNDRNGNPMKLTNVLVSLDGKNHTLTTDNEGKATLPIDSLPSNYVAEITYAGDDVYVASSAVSNVSIEKVATSLSTSDVRFIYDEPTDLIVTLTDRKGNAMKSTNVSITLDGKNHTLTTDNEGKVALPIDSLPGIYLAEISYAGDDVYVESTAGSQITIEKIETIMTANNIGVIYGDEANLIVTLKDRKGNAVSGMDISIALDGKDYLLTTNANGQVTLAVDSLPGDYLAEILYTGDDVYVSSSVSSDISIYKIVTGLTSTDISFIYDDPANLIMTLKDGRGNPLADKDISVSIDGVRNMVTTASNGQAAFAIDVLPGSYVAEISFAGDNVYVSSNTSSNIKIDKVSTSLTANDVQFIYGDLTYLVATLKDRKGNEVAGKDILITLDGANHTVTTDSNGQAKLAVDSLPGNYTAKISFAGDKVFIDSSASADVSIDKISTILSANDITAIYGNTKSLTVILKDERGKFLAGQNITILINNKIYKRTTDENGRAVLSINLAVKKYTAVIDLKGDAIYKPSTYTSKVVINKATPTLTALSKIFSAKSKTKKVTVTLKNKNNAIKNALVKLTVNKKTYKVKTNSKGVATFKVKLTKRGKYNAVYKYAGNSNFKSATKKVKITLI